MKKKKYTLEKYKILAIIFLICSLNYVYPNNKSKLLNKRDKIYNEIKSSEKLLKSIANSEKDLYSSIVLNEKKIKLREELINSLNDEIQFLDYNIDSISNLVIQNEKKLNLNKNELSKLIYYYYYRINEKNIMLVILTSNNVSILVRRLYYLKKYSSYQKNLIKNIKNELNKLYELKNQLNTIKTKKNKIIIRKLEEKNELEKDLYNSRLLLEQYKTREKEIRFNIEKLKNEAKIIDQQIRKIVEEEIKKNKKVENNKEYILDNKNFAYNKGKLSHPVNNGVIISSFGEQNHPIYKGIKIVNNGIDYSVNCNEPVMAVFEGIVAKILILKGSNYVLIIRHGKFYSVYQNLTNIIVNTNQKVKTSQIIGYTNCNIDDKISKLHFEIWEEMNKHDPEEWLKK